jgi:transcription elongation factor/antiterminator RfaH
VISDTPVVSVVGGSISLEILDDKVASRRVNSLREGERWYAVHSLPHAEGRAEAQLRNQQFYTFLPRRQKTIRHARKLSTVIAPFFPRYLFIALDLNRDRWRSVNGTFGVSSLIMAGDLPCPAPHGIIESMLAIADAESVLQLHSNLKVGAQVRLASGPFAEQLGILDRLDDSGRIRVLLNIFGRQVPVFLNQTHALPAA